MAFGRYSRVDGRKSSSHCSTISVIVFVAFCLVGIWVFMSSTVPVEDQELPSEEPVSEVKRHIVTDDDSKQFEDTSGDAQLTEEVRQEETAAREQSEAETESRNEPDERMGSEDGNANPTGADLNTEATEVNESERPEPEERQESSDETKQDVDQQSSSEQSDGQDGAESELLRENKVEDGGAWSTQAVESQNEKKSQQKSQNGQAWKLCNVTAGPDYIPCLDNWGAIRKLRSTKHYEHRERHCPEEPPTCLVSLPEGYKKSVKWPISRDKVCQF